MSVTINGKYNPMYRFQLGVPVTQTPVQNTWYTILEKNNVVVYTVVVNQVNDETDAKAVEVRITYDKGGSSITGSVTQNNNSPYYWYNLPTANTMYASTTTSLDGTALSTHYTGNVKIEMRTTAALGTNPVLYGYVTYSMMTGAK